MYLNPKKHKEERGFIWRHLKIEYDWKMVVTCYVCTLIEVFL